MWALTDDNPIAHAVLLYAKPKSAGAVNDATALAVELLEFGIDRLKRAAHREILFI